MDMDEETQQDEDNLMNLFLLRQLGYGVSSNTTDEYVRIGETTAQQTLKNFTSSVIHIYSARYLQKQTNEDLNLILKENAA
jgi:hypothetical protein